MDSSLQRLRTITENFESWQGLRLVPQGFACMVVGMMSLLVWNPPSWWTLSSSVTIALVIPCVLPLVWVRKGIERYYRTTFGDVVESQGRKSNLSLSNAFPWIWMGTIVDGLLIEAGVRFLVSPLVLAFLIWRHWSITGQERKHHLAIAALSGVASLLPLALPWSKDLHTANHFFLVAGLVLVVVGLLDHRELVRAVRPLLPSDLEDPSDEAGDEAPVTPKSPVPALERMRQLTESYPSWQGLRVLPSSLTFMALGLFVDREVSWLPPLWAFLAILLMGALALTGLGRAIDRYYRNQFGEVLDSARKERNRRIATLVSVLTSAFLLDSLFKLPILLSGFTAAAVVLVHWYQTGRGRSHYPVTAAVCALAAFVPLFVPVVWTDPFSTVRFAGLIGAMVTILGVLDHMALVRSMAPLREEEA